ncbi:hypothetical protein E2562_011000 [Oryza meyeriana var. granulata]|uniref:Uncharacterized protein n=1 Tax=Oryza meyeriana var. granulata TaxID=110450 RepID=A0A6G1BUZ6_9ORYZ|nr:hypothetical protein E2562_011000 [Oryza meyeriana var. granulata]
MKLLHSSTIDVDGGKAMLLLPGSRRGRWKEHYFVCLGMTTPPYVGKRIAAVAGQWSTAAALRRGGGGGAESAGSATEAASGSRQRGSGGDRRGHEGGAVGSEADAVLGLRRRGKAAETAGGATEEPSGARRRRRRKLDGGGARVVAEKARCGSAVASDGCGVGGEMGWEEAHNGVGRALILLESGNDLSPWIEEIYRYKFSFK